MRSISYLLVIVFPLCATEFPKIELSDITCMPPNAHRITRRHALLWLDESSQSYYKIWPKNYRLAHYFEQAVQCGFYDHTNTMLTGLIYSDTVCCGYITKKAERNSTNCDDLTELESFKFYRHTLYRIAKAEHQSNAYKLFFNDLLERTKKHGLVYMDFNRHNIVIDHGIYKLIDLEYVLPFEKVINRFFSNMYLPTDYRQLIETLLLF